MAHSQIHPGILSDRFNSSMNTDFSPKSQARHLLLSVIAVALIIGFILAVSFGLILHFGFGLDFHQILQSIFFAFRR